MSWKYDTIDAMKKRLTSKLAKDLLVYMVKRRFSGYDVDVNFRYIMPGMKNVEIEVWLIDKYGKGHDFRLHANNDTSHLCFILPVPNWPKLVRKMIDYAKRHYVFTVGSVAILDENDTLEQLLVEMELNS